MNLLITTGISLHIDRHLKEKMSNYVDILTNNLHLCIENRPNYCDRGKFIVKVWNRGNPYLIDTQDAFPRYYYWFENMIIEINAFLLAKKENDIDKIKYGKLEIVNL